jgi:hypothetical protein
MPSWASSALRDVIAKTPWRVPVTVPSARDALELGQPGHAREQLPAGALVVDPGRQLIP